MQNVCTCLWFDDQAEAAVALYTSLLPNSRILETSHYLKGAPRPEGTVLTIRFSLDGTEYLALNGGPHFTLSPAASITVYCDSQTQIDTLWQRLTADGGQESQCGWLTDRFGLSWQIVPRVLLEFVGAADRAAAQRAFDAVMTMVKLDIAALQRAYDGKVS